MGASDGVWESNGFRVFPDGNVWCGTAPGFVNLQESKAVFANNPIDASLMIVADAIGDLNYRITYGPHQYVSGFMEGKHSAASLLKLIAARETNKS